MEIVANKFNDYFTNMAKLFADIYFTISPCNPFTSILKSSFPPSFGLALNSPGEMIFSFGI